MNKLFLPGCKTSKGGWTCSTGTPSLDALLGGYGLPIGSVLFLQDEAGYYSHYFCCRFVSDSIDCGHKILVLGDVNSHVFDKYGTRDFEKVSSSEQDILDQGSAIAWRYKNMPYFDSSVGKKVTVEKSTRVPMKWVTLQSSDLFQRIDFPFSDSVSKYCEILNAITSEISKDEYDLSSADAKKRLLRVLIVDFGAPTYGLGKQVEFLVHLKLLMQNRSGVIVISGSSRLLTPQALQRLQHFSDTHFVVQSLSEEDGRQNVRINKTFREYSGLIRVGKMPSLNCLNFLLPPCRDLGFRWKGKGFLMENLHLPPCEEGEETSDVIKNDFVA